MPSGGGGGQRQAAADQPRVGQVLELTCSDLAFGGEGICRLPGGFVVFVDRALPGERLTAQIVQQKKRWARAAKLASLAPHEHAVEPACQHFGPCGGCTLQHLAYEAQLAAKQRQVADLLRRTAGLPEGEVAAALRPIVGCPPGQQLEHRNKMEFSFGRYEWAPEQGSLGSSGSSGSSSGSASAGTAVSSRRRRGAAAAPPAAPPAAPDGSSAAAGGFALGLHRPGCDSSVLPIARCRLQPDAANLLLARVGQLCRELGLEAFDPATGTGLLQHVVIRRGSGGSSDSSSSSDSGSSESSSSQGGEEYLLNIVTAADGRQALAPLAAALMRQPLAPQPQEPGGAAAAAGAVQPAAPAQPAPRLVGVVNSVSQRGRPAGERRLAGEAVLAGRGHLVDRLCGLEFEVSANSFFQTNSAQAGALYRLVAQAAGLRPGDTLLDLYCGTGSIGLVLAAACPGVALHGVEISDAAVRDARRNAARNAVANARFVQGDLASLQLEGLLPTPDVVVVDPARPGLSPAVVDYLARCGARRVVYVSCNASTQARDLAALCGGGGGGGGGGAPYRLAALTPVDLYPQTWHVETVAVLDAVQ